MKVFVAGPIGYDGEDIRELQRMLRSDGFEVLDQFVVDYSSVEDFRNEADLRRKIVANDLALLNKADAVVLIATKPSFGAMCEALLASQQGKPVIAYCPSAVKSPWPLEIASHIARSYEELVSALRSVSTPLRRIPNLYGEHEAEFEYSQLKCVCPVTGIEDRAVVRIRYRPDRWLLEYESLDEYFRGFANVKIHHEAVVRKIYEDLAKLIEPLELEVEAEFERRSGVKAVVRIRGSRSL
ncbi:MAG: nucleoside 2-deoxyribosyltransferase [Archaeoglobaceae archaeon]